MSKAYKYIEQLIGLLCCFVAGTIAGHYAWQCVLAVILAIFGAGLLCDVMIFWKEEKQ